MIPFLSAEPKVPGDIPARVQLGQTGGGPPGRRFDSFMSEAATAEEMPVEGAQGEGLLAGEELPIADLDMAATEETLIKRALPDTAAPVAVLARPVPDAATPEEGVPIRKAVGLDKTGLPTRAAQVWAALSEGEQPAPLPMLSPKAIRWPGFSQPCARSSPQTQQ